MRQLHSPPGVEGERGMRRKREWFYLETVLPGSWQLSPPHSQNWGRGRGLSHWLSPLVKHGSHFPPRLACQQHLATPQSPVPHHQTGHGAAGEEEPLRPPQRQANSPQAAVTMSLDDDCLHWT